MDLVAVGHPGCLVLGLTGKQRACVGFHRRTGGAVFPQPGLADLATQFPRHNLEAIANAEDGDPQLENSRAQAGRSFFIDAGRTTTENDGNGILRLDFVGAGFVGHDF